MSLLPNTGYFLKLESRGSAGFVQGESRDKAHQRWIELLSLVWAPRPAVAAGGRERIQEVECTKLVDRVSNRLAAACTRAEVFPRAVIHVTEGKGTWIELHDVYVARCRALPASVFSGERAESFVLNFTGIGFSVGPPAPAGSSRPVRRWDDRAVGALLRHQQRQAPMRG